MSTLDQVGLLLEDPAALHDDWFVRVSLHDVCPDYLHARLPALQAQARDPLRLERWLASFAAGRMAPDLFEELLDREGLLHLLAGVEPEPGGEGAPEAGVISALADFLFEEADAAIAWASWLSHRVAFALAVYWIVGLGLGLGVKALLRMGLGRIGL